MSHKIEMANRIVKAIWLEKTTNVGANEVITAIEVLSVVLGETVGNLMREFPPEAVDDMLNTVSGFTKDACNQNIELMKQKDPEYAKESSRQAAMKSKLAAYVPCKERMN